MARRLLASILALVLIAAACSSEAAEETTTTLAPTTTTTTQAPATTTTLPPSSTTSTIAYAALNVAVEGEPGLTAAVTELYAWFGDRTLPPPVVPDGMVDHFDGVYPTTGSASYTGVLTSAEVGDLGTAGVVMVNGEDVILVVDDIEEEDEDDTGWRVVGAWLRQYGAEPWFGDALRYVFVIGTDARPGELQPHLRADSLHILSSNIAERSGGVLGFPRDTLVEAPYSADKFTNVNANMYTLTCGRTTPDNCDEPNKGQDTMVDLAAELSGLPLEGWIVTGFLSFTQLVDAFGGVEVDVPFAMAEPKSEAYFRAGLQVLFGSDALAFSRNRTIDGGDFTRSFHHGLVILGALDGVLENEITMTPALLAILAEHTWTNLSLEDLLTVAAGAVLLEPDSVGNEVLPGTVGTYSNFSVVRLVDGAEDLFRDMDDGSLTPRDGDS